ncbi:RNA-binding protein [Paraneptunicella aestuarii]|uniref:RNA recognition motif domain-containing protein n=1 Tax=Paraneptunicella aestuarii TaxID=2831148 RepID=UPI001E3B8932|nr:RNA-binding protein [Paraneptunicella aestuarii]UAA39750.1 RNA-binding protein [Paraneptunicella aestuarii]
MSILIRNLPRTITENELRVLFQAFGDVASCTLVLDKETGGSKGFGFVEMSHNDDVNVAIEALNGSVVSGNKIRVKWSNQESFNQPQAHRVSIDGQNVWGNTIKKMDEEE